VQPFDQPLSGSGAGEQFWNGTTMTRIIDNLADLAEGTAALIAIEPRWQPVAERAGTLPLRRRNGGFGGLAGIIVAQQLSVASAAAIWARVEKTFDPLTPASFVGATDEQYRAAGLSRPKQRTLRALATAFHEGHLNPSCIESGSRDEIHGHLTKLSGIGPWTADIYLMFCLGHADAFAPGDLALQEAAKMMLDLPSRPKPDELDAIARDWSPWRGVAARLLWAYYGAVKAREGAPT
jgi:DNA-3-methyladenine glycosylase II